MKRYFIRIQRRCEYNGLYPRDDFRAYREYMVWPKTFRTQSEALRFMEICFTFRGIYGRKVSACVVSRTIPESGYRV